MGGLPPAAGAAGGPKLNSLPRPEVRARYAPRRATTALPRDLPSCYNRAKVVCQRGRKERVPVLTAELFWKLFEVTGSISAYLLYRRYAEE